MEYNVIIDYPSEKDKIYLELNANKSIKIQHLLKQLEIYVRV